MALNPFSSDKVSSSEQRLVQDLVNEHLKIFGIEVDLYSKKIREIVKQYLEEVQSSKFDELIFRIEA
jgi:hypothetical protein